MSGDHELESYSSSRAKSEGIRRSDKVQGVLLSGGTYAPQQEIC